MYDSLNLSQVDAQNAVQATIESLTKLLLEYGRVELRGFGVFTVQTRAARKGRNPRNGEEIYVEEHETVVFKPSRLVRDMLDAKRKLKRSKSAAKKQLARPM